MRPYEHINEIAQQILDLKHSGFSHYVIHPVNGKCRVNPMEGAKPSLLPLTVLTRQQVNAGLSGNEWAALTARIVKLQKQGILA
jgi:predicted component of type VI protein secretion system